MNWLPRFHVYGHCIAEDDFEAEGTVLQVIWGTWVFEISLARMDRVFDGETADAR